MQAVPGLERIISCVALGVCHWETGELSQAACPALSLTEHHGGESGATMPRNPL